MRSVAPLRPGGSGTAKSSSPTSRKPFGSGLGNPDSTPSNRWSRNSSGACRQLMPPALQKGTHSMTTAKDVMKMIEDNDVKYADFRFTDPRGKWQHVTFDRSLLSEDTFAEGQMFDGSSIAGWQAIHESDLNLMPDQASAVI